MRRTRDSPGSGWCAVWCGCVLSARLCLTLKGAADDGSPLRELPKGEKVIERSSVTSRPAAVVRIAVCLQDPSAAWSAAKSQGDTPSIELVRNSWERLAPKLPNDTKLDVIVVDALPVNVMGQRRAEQCDEFWGPEVTTAAQHLHRFHRT